MIGAVVAAAVVNTTSFFIAYATALAAAIMVLSLLGHASVVLVDCAGHTELETLLHEQAVEISVYSDSLNGCPHADFALHSTWHDFWV